MTATPPALLSLVHRNLCADCKRNGVSNFDAGLGGISVSGTEVRSSRTLHPHRIRIRALPRLQHTHNLIQCVLPVIRHVPQQRPCRCRA